jgi:hypothetical protein
MKLPPLPLPQRHVERGGVFVPAYSTDQMRAYAAATAAAARERCAAQLARLGHHELAHCLRTYPVLPDDSGDTPLIVERFGENSAWPGNYRELDVDLAWCAWSAAMAATRERCAQIALDAPMVDPPLDDDPPEVDTALKSMAVSIAARIRGLEPLPRHGVQTGLDFGA